MEPLARYKIILAENSQWSVLDTDRKQILFANKTFQSPELALAALQDLGKERGWTVSTASTSDLPNQSLKAYPARGIQLDLNLPPTVSDRVARVLAETGDTPGVMFGKALGLYLLALDARKRGKVVGAADTPEALETEFTGF